MKKIILLFLLIGTTISYGQTTLANKLKITSNVTSTTAAKVNVQEADGVINTIAKADLIDVLEFTSASTLPITGVSGKIYVTIDNGKMYRWNGTIYIEVSSTEKFIKSNESLSLAQRKGDILYGILDQYTGEEITLSKVSGTPVVDGIIFFELGTEYFKRNNIEIINVRWFGAKGDNLNDDTVAIQNAINFTGTFNGTCIIPSGVYKTTNTLVINTGISLVGEELTSTTIKIVSTIRKPVVKIDSKGTNGYIRGGGIKKITIDGGEVCDGILIDVLAPYSINQAVYEDIKIIHSVLGFETRVSDGTPLIYICVFSNIAVEQGIVEGGFKLKGGTYNTYSQLSASDGGSSDYYGFDIYQVGSTFTNVTTDSWSTFYNLYGITTNYVCESTTLRNSLPLRHSALNILTGSYNSLFFGNLAKGRYNRIVKLNNGEISIRTVEINNWSSVLQDSFLDISVADGSGLIESVRTLNPFSLKVEDYVTAVNLQYYRFLNCESITNLSLKIARVVSVLPTPTEKLRYSEITLVLGAGIPDAMYVCVKNKSNTYEWVEKYNSKNAKNLTNNTFQNIDANLLNGEGKFTAFPILAASTNIFPTVNNANAIINIDMYEGTSEFAQLGFNAAGEIYHRYSTGAWSKIVKENSSPTFTGTPTAPTAVTGTNTTQLATTAFVLANSSSIPQLESNSTDLTVWNNGKGNIATNTSFGDGALKSNTTGFNNTALGQLALSGNTTGNNNIALGAGALANLTNGGQNTALGNDAGSVNGSSVANNSSSNSLFLGRATKPLSSGQNNEIVIGDNATGAGSNTATLGNTSITNTILRGAVTTNGSFINSTAPATNALLAGGTTLAVAPSTGGAGYIQNQNASAQSANMWISGNSKFSGAFPYQEIRPTAWTGSFYMQSGLNLSASGVGDYTGLQNPAGKGFFFARGATNDLEINTIGAATFSSSVTATAHVTTGGTSSQFVKGDGSLGVAPDSRPYKVYTALLSQTGTAVPTAVILENTLGGIIVWSRSSTGSYIGTLTGAFTNLKTWTTIGGNYNTPSSFLRLNRSTLDVVSIVTESGGISDNVLENTSIEIRVYN